MKNLTKLLKDTSLDFPTDLFRESILAGGLISLAGLGYLIIGGLEGAILFGVGLLGVVYLGGVLYTGKIYTTSSPTTLALILLGNMVGCMIFGWGIVCPCFPEVITVAEGIIASRLSVTLPAVLGRAICCGILMTLAIQGTKGGSTWPLLLGVTLFVMAGFYHSVADFFYFTVSPDLSYLPRWVLVVVGNFIGGKLGWIKK